MVPFEGRVLMALSDAASAAAAAVTATFAQALAVLPAAFVLFWCLWRCRKAAAFLGLLFKDILREAAPLFLLQWQSLPLFLPQWATRPVAVGGVPPQELAWEHTH